MPHLPSRNPGITVALGVPIMVLPMRAGPGVTPGNFRRGYKGGFTPGFVVTHPQGVQEGYGVVENPEPHLAIRGPLSRQGIELSRVGQGAQRRRPTLHFPHTQPMLLTITTTHAPASDLGFLLHKHPDRFQTFELSFGQAHVFYPENSSGRCTACLLLAVDPVGLARGRSMEPTGLLASYVNDRPYVASSLLSVAIAQVYGTALQGRCKDRPELASRPIPLSARLDVVPVRGGEALVHKIFEPLGYTLEAHRVPLDERFPEWGESSHFALTLHKTTTLSELLTHLYVLVPVFDNHKHYFVGEAEVDKLLAKGTGWLAAHPLKEEIAARYLNHRPSLTRQALARLLPEEAEETDEGQVNEPAEERLEKPLSLNEQRLQAVREVLQSCGARRVLDLGCGEGKLLREILRDRQFTTIMGLDVSIRALEVAQRRLKLDQLPGQQGERVRLVHGSLMYRDRRLEGFDAAVVVEVIEHLDPPRLSAFERVLFEFARPGTVVLTTPNQEYNALWETLPAGRFRHPDHRFEWTRQEFQTWAQTVADRFGYAVRFVHVGPSDEQRGSPTQMGIFTRQERQGEEQAHD
jgi:3' terminal RNA ribose 2'-O-methyltransferase Hen1